MTSIGVLQIAIFFGLILICTKPLGAFMARLFEGERTFLHPVLRWLEVLTYKAIGVKEEVEQRWTQYTAALLSFSVFGFLLTYLLQRIQGVLPLNPQNFNASNVPPDLAFNTATSFVTNTNWQAYAGEATLSYFVQMAALAVQNFASAAAGMAIAVALIRGFSRQEKKTIGNFWVDVTRATVYVLLPLSVIAALLFVSQGVVQNFKPYTDVSTVEGAKQTIAQGPVASQEAIKQLGTNGGGFFNANSAHPFENPTPLSNLLQMFLIFLIPAALTYTFGKMVGDTRQGWAIFAAFSVMFLIGVFVCYHFEQAGNPIMANMGIQSTATAGQSGGSMEGKETRFGIANSALFATVTTDASCGAVNAMHDSFTPLGGLVPMFNIMTGEVIFGGVGAGLYGILLYCILAVFIAGLMVGRTPEYIGKKIEQKEVKMAMLAVIATGLRDPSLQFPQLGDHVPGQRLLESAGRDDRQYQQQRPSRLERDYLRLYQRRRQQWQRFRGNHRKHALVRPHHRPGYVDRTIPVPDPVARRGGKSRREEEDPIYGGNVPHARTFVRGIAGRHRDYCRRANLLPGAFAGTDCRTLPDGKRQAVFDDALDSSGDLELTMSTTTTTEPTVTPQTPQDDPTSLLPKKLVRARPLFDPEIVRKAIAASFAKLNPVTLMKNPVMFVVEVGAAMTTLFLIRDLFTGATLAGGSIGFQFQISLWLWFTVLFANFAEAMAEARGKAQADALRKTKTDVLAKRISASGKIEQAPGSALRVGDVVICDAADLIPGDGEVIEGIATVDESVITGESAPVIRESGGDRSAVTGGTRVLSDQIKIRITSNPGETFLDRMIALVEGAQRQKTPNEIALNILIAGLTLIFLLAVITLQPYSVFSVAQAGSGTIPTVAVLVSLLVCLIPTTIGGLLSAIGIAGMDRVMQHNVLAMSGKAVEAAGDVNSLLLDKTGTITLGNRQAVEFLTITGVTDEELADAAQLSSLADETPEGRSVVILAKEKYGLRGRHIPEHEATFIPFSAYTRMSGVDFEGRQLRKGATDAVITFGMERGGDAPG